jgi:aspartyl-tRNA(Asn)/glutamyl-tRNA(Gln) amidotransferase subunit B
MVAAGADPKLAKNWLLGSVLAKMNELALGDADSLRPQLSPAALAELLTLIERGTVSGSMAKDVFEKMLASGERAETIVAREGLTQIEDESRIAGLIGDALRNNADAVAEYRAGKSAAFGFLVGQVMKAAGGKANPRRVNELLKKSLEA